MSLAWLTCVGYWQARRASPRSPPSTWTRWTPRSALRLHRSVLAVVVKARGPQRGDELVERAQLGQDDQVAPVKPLPQVLDGNGLVGQDGRHLLPPFIVGI
jgi:hypothetical protein